MQRRIPKRLLVNSFWLSVLLHLLFLLAFTTIIVFQPEENPKSPNFYVPAHVYSTPVAPKVQAQAMRAEAQRQETVKQSAKQQTSSNRSETQQAQSNKGYQQAAKTSNKTGLKKTILAKTMDMLHQNQMRQVTSSLKNSEPIYLIGEHNVPTDPMVLLIGKALSANFSYPKTAGELGIKGRVLVGMTIHPEGYFSDVEIIRSSDDHDLDAAALYAVNQAPTIEGMDRFISEPKHFVVGFVFR